MKKIILFILVCLFAVSLASCEDTTDHTGQIKIPTSASALKGKNYEEVVQLFEDSGFTNIEVEAIEDLVTGWLTKDGEVEDVSIAGNVKFSAGQWIEPDSKIVIRYHTFPKQEEPESGDGDGDGAGSVGQGEILTVENCEELLSILSNKSEYDSSYTAFAEKYKGMTIAFDGRIDYITKHGKYDTRFDILVSAGDYDPDSQVGPIFKFEDVNAYDLGLDTLYLTDELNVGMNVRIVAKVGSFNVNSYLFFIEPVSVSER